VTLGDVVIYAAIGVCALLVLLTVIAAILLVAGGRSLARGKREDIA
jgi:hypothetical protein